MQPQVVVAVEEVLAPRVGGVEDAPVKQARAVLDAWGSDGTGVRALLDGPALLVLLDRLADDAAATTGERRLQEGPQAADRPV